MTIIQKTAELALALALADQLEPKTQQGRLKTLFRKLEKTVMDEFKDTRKLTRAESEAAKRIVIRFADVSGWDGKPRHICTKINFLLALYEDRPYAQKIIPVLNNIYEYFDRAGDAPAASLWSGCLAMEKWEAVLKEAA